MICSLRNKADVRPLPSYRSSLVHAQVREPVRVKFVIRTDRARDLLHAATLLRTVEETILTGQSETKAPIS